MYEDDGMTEEERQWGNPFGDTLCEAAISENEKIPPAPTSKRKSGSAVNGLEARRGMALKINIMLSQGVFSAEEIATAIIPETQHLSRIAAVAKLQAHLRNLRRHGGKVVTSAEGVLICKEVVLPVEVMKQAAGGFA